MQYDILYLISHGFAARMILQTALIPELYKINPGIKIAVAFESEYDSSLENLAKNLGADAFFADFKHTLQTSDYMTFRNYVYEDIKRNPALFEKHIRAKSSKSIKRKAKYFYYSSVNKLANAFPVIKKGFKKREQRLLQNDKLSRLSSNLDANVVVSTYPVNFFESAMLNIAKKSNVITVMHLLSWDNITCKGHFPVLPDYFISWGPVMSNEMKEYYNFSTDKIFETGAVHFDAHINEIHSDKLSVIKAGLGLDIDDVYILFAMSSPYFAPMEIEIVEKLAKWTEEKIFGDIKLIVRPHPQNVEGTMSDSSWLHRLKKIESKNVKVQYPSLQKTSISWTVKDSDLIELANLISGCSVLLNSGSTITIEGLIQKKPVILTLFDADKKLPWHLSASRIKDYIHIKKIIDKGAVEVANSFKELMGNILASIKDPDANLNKRKIAAEMECGPADGNSAKRAAKALAALIKK